MSTFRAPVYHPILLFVAALTVSASLAVAKEDDTRSNYYPNTEALKADEMRVIALGTGTPNFRRSQASAAWLVELGSGEKFLFDIGTGSLANLAAPLAGKAGATLAALKRGLYPEPLAALGCGE